MAPPHASTSDDRFHSTRKTRRSEAEHGRHAQRATTLFPNARDLQIADSNFSIVGRDVVHNHYERPKDIWAILQSIPNFRRIYLDMLSKATPGTGMWLLKGKRFRLWLEPNGDIKIFWGSGIPGAGKTLLASIVIECLETLRLESNATICICYVYFHYSDRSAVTVRNVLEIFVKQALERHPECRGLIEDTYAQHVQEGSEPTEVQLLELLQKLVSHMASTFFILDALDQAPTKIQLAVVKMLTSLNVKLFITSRELKAVEASFPEAYTFPIIAHGEDIDLHIAKGLAGSPDLQNLIRQAGPSLREEIVSTIKENCGGMFLHASLQLDALCGCVSTHQVRRTLHAFPSKIEDVYLQTWDRILKEYADHVSLVESVLVCVLNASRSMTIEELERAVATSPKTYKFEPDRLVPGTTLVSMCHGLITVDPESRLVRLVHNTAKATLERLIHESFPHPHSLLAAVCVEHLAECGFQNTTIASAEEFKTALKEDPLLAYASEAWAFHARESLEVDDSLRRTAQFVAGCHAFPTFISNDRSTSFDILKPLHIVALNHLPLVLIKDAIVGNPNVATQIHLQSPLMIASRFGYDGLVAHLLTLSEIDVNLTRYGRSALIMAAREGHEGVVELLLGNSKPQVNLVDTSGWSALMSAAHGGYEGIVKLLLVHHEILFNLVTKHGVSALMLAASQGHEGVVGLLLGHREAQVNLADANGWSALMSAAHGGHEGIVKLLLGHHETQANQITNRGASALRLAASQGHEGVVRLLLGHHEIQVNLVDANGWSALISAAHGGHEGTVKLLLGSPSIQTNLVTHKGWSALMSAAHGGHEGIIKLLLDHHEIQVNLVKADGWSALMLAASNGHEGAIKLLMGHRGTQINLVGTTNGWTALMSAANGGFEGVVKLLLGHHDIQINLLKANEWSALILAATNGHESVVKLLMGHCDTQINLAGTNGWTALISAAHGGHEGVAKLLLGHRDIQVNLVNDQGLSALMSAAHEGHTGTVKLLLDHHEVQVNLVNTDGWSVIMLAASRGHEGVVKLLMGHRNTQVDVVDAKGWTALMSAAAGGHEAVVKLLFEYRKLRVNRVNNQGSSALMQAAKNGHRTVVELLLATDNVDVNVFDKKRNTAIKMAAAGGHEAIVRQLLDMSDIDTGIRSTTDGHTAMSAAQANGHTGIVELLEEFESAKVVAPVVSQPRPPRQRKRR